MHYFWSFKQDWADQYIAQIILEEAKRITTETTKVPPALDDNTFDAPAVAIKKEDFLSYP